MNANRIRTAIILWMALLLASCGTGGGGGGGGGTTPPGDTTVPPVAIVNIRNNSVVHTGFLVATASDDVGLTSVEVALDGGAYRAATLSSGTTWTFKLPTGASTWRDGTQHTIDARATDAAGNTGTAGPITVRKGVNRDVNGDGYEDVVVGAFLYNTEQGRAYVFHSAGSSGVASADLSAGGTAHTTLTGAAIESDFGVKVALGDANGDGYADVLVGAHRHNAYQGRVYIFHSAGSMGVASADLSSGGSAHTVLTGVAASQFGIAVAAGDVNGDGYADVVVGARGVASSSGAAYVFHSAGDEGVPSADLSGAGSANTTLSGETNTSFGGSAALGDVTGDGRADVLVGAYRYGSTTGRAYLFHSAGDGGVPSVDLAGADSANTTLTGASNDNFGIAVALGDATGDGYADVLVGASGAVVGTGHAYLFHSAGAGGVASADLSSGGSAHTRLTGEANTTLGDSVAMGDVNGDGYADVLVGARRYGSFTGRAYVFHSAGSGGVADTDLSSGGIAATTLTGPATNHYFGETAALSDVNGDGCVDVLVAARGFSSGTGRAYVFHSAGSGGVASADLSAGGSAQSTLTGEATSSFGSALW